MKNVPVPVFPAALASPAQRLRLAVLADPQESARLDVGGWSFVLSAPSVTYPQWAMDAARALGAQTDGATAATNPTLRQWWLSAKRLDR